MLHLSVLAELGLSINNCIDLANILIFFSLVFRCVCGLVMLVFGCRTSIWLSNHRRRLGVRAMGQKALDPPRIPSEDFVSISSSSEVFCPPHT